MSTFTLRNNTYNIDDGSVVIKNYNETLDSATIKISNLSTEIDIEPFDLCTYYDSRLGTLYFCVDTYTKTQISINPNIYNYDISLFSQTKLLEGVLLPSISITPHKTGTKLKIYQVLQRYLDEYCPIRNNNTKKWVLDNTISVKFNVDCPELQWNQPTLREVFTTLMQVCDCLPILRNGEIGWIDLTKTQQIASTNEINYITESRSSEDYCSEIKMQLQNVFQTSQPNVNNIVVKSEWSPYVCNDAIMTTDNFVLETEYPILNIKHLWVCFECVYGVESTYQSDDLIFKFDLCDLGLISEYNEYITKQVAFRKSSINPFTLANFKNYQNTSLYYNRNGKEILGWNTTTKKIGYNFTTIQYIIQRLMIEYKPEFITQAGFVLFKTAETEWYTNTFFKIEYETTADCVFRASKENKPSNDRFIVDNQTNSWVDADTQANLEYQKANRLGNVNKLINARFTSNYTNLIKLGDKWNEDIVYKTEYQVYNDHIEVNAQATQDYVLKNYFTGVDSKIRTWVNAKDEAFIRHDLVKLYCELDYTNISTSYVSTNIKGFQSVNGFDESILSGYLLQFLNNSNIKPIKYCSINTNSITYIPSTESFLIDTISKKLNKSIVLTAGMVENSTISRISDYALIESENMYKNTPGTEHTKEIYLQSTLNQNGIPYKNISYVNNNFEFDKITFNFGTNLDSNVDFNNNYYTLLTRQESLDFVKSVYKKPQITTSSLTDLISFSINYTKDNKEIPRVSFQFEFSGNEDIKVYDKFIEYQKAIYIGSNYLPLYFEDFVSHNYWYGCEFIVDSTDYKKIKIGWVGAGQQKETQAEAEVFRQELIGNKAIITDKDHNRIFEFTMKNTNTAVEQYVVGEDTMYIVVCWVFLNIKRNR